MIFSGMGSPVIAAGFQQSYSNHQGATITSNHQQGSAENGGIPEENRRRPTPVNTGSPDL
ncbi:hypothetical protein [Azospirillum brasilense]|uniref:hypothetical protein n=1 Tax=Azospirillum brasilense TaxID=192 RepID=UPI0011ED74AB|nr:hypothetical protein [Azospirillum brasilense]